MYILYINQDMGGLMFIIKENEFREPSSNPVQDCISLCTNKKKR